MNKLLHDNPVGYLLRRLQQQTNLGHTEGLTQVRGATSWKHQGAEDVELVDNVMVTCSKDGTAGVWTREFGAFRLLCFLMHMNQEGSMAVVNDAAAFVDENGGFLHVLTGSADGSTRLWSFQRSACSGLPYEHFADKENHHGIAQRLEPEAQVYHACELCKTNHAVLSLAVLPRHGRQGDKTVFNFIAGTAKGTAEIYSVRRLTESQGDKPSFEIVPIRGKEREMKHKEETSIYSVAAARDFLQTEGAALLVATCDGLGLTKLWRLEEIAGDTCGITHLRTFVHQESGKVFSLRCVKFTPSFNIPGFAEDEAPRYLVTSSFNALKQERSRIFVWSLQDVAHTSASAYKALARRNSLTKTKVERDPDSGELSEYEEKRSFVFRANNIAFWFPRDTGTSITMSGTGAGAVEKYVYCITSAPDCSAKMFKLINMKTGRLTLPLLKGQRELSFKRDGVDAEEAEVEADDLATIVKTYRHKSQVQAVLAVRMREEVDVDAARQNETYASLLSTPGAIAESWYFVAAGEDGSANMWDPFTGQGVHTLRPAAMKEMYLPLLLQFITTWQLMAFSLDEAFRWNHKMVAGPRYVSNILILDANTLRRHINFLHEDQMFLSCLVLSAVGVALFMVIVVSDIVGREHRQMLELEVSEQYRREVKRGQTGLTSKQMGPAHRQYRRAMVRQRVWTGVIWACPMVAMVPMVKTVVRFFDCDRDAGHEPPYFVHRAEWMACYQGVHLGVAPFLAMLLCPFMILTLPFRVVSGDASVVAWQDLWDWKQWKRNAVQKTSQTDLGPMQMDAHNQFFASAVETFAKVAAPVASIMLTSRVLLRAVLLSAIHLVVVAFSILRPTHTKPSINTLFVGIKCIGLWVSGFAVLALCEVAHSRTIMWVMYGILFVHFLVTMCIYARQYERELKDDKQFHSAMVKERGDSEPNTPATAVSFKSEENEDADPDEAEDEAEKGRCGCL